MQARLTRIGTLTVEHLSGVDYGPLDPAAHTRPKGVQHTTEGGFEGSLQKLRAVDSPHFLLGRDRTGKIRCVQLVPVGLTAGALEHPKGTPATNALATVQIELVEYSKRHPWLPDPGVTEALVHLYTACLHEYKIPLKHIPNPGRDRHVYELGSGWFGHADVPDQPSGHWDPGDLDYATLFERAAEHHVAPAWYKAASAQKDPMWAWIIWRDHGSPPKLRPAKIPARVPRSWFARYALHKGT